MVVVVYNHVYRDTRIDEENHGDEDDDVNYARVACDLVYTNA